MKHFYGCIALLFSTLAFAQELETTTDKVNEIPETSNIEVSYFRGNIYKHTDYVTHLISGHPDGVLISFNQQTFGAKEWQQAYNFPDYGLSFQYQDFANEHLGKALALGVHYNFYFLNRHLQFRISQGIGIATNPYDKETNFKNNAFGSRLLSSNLFMLNYKKQNLVGRFGVQAGLMFTHFSNGRIKSPNSGINTYAANIGINYNVDANQPQYVSSDTLSRKTWAEPLRYSLYFRSGVSESIITGSGQKPFYHISLAVDKRIGRKSAFQFGTDIFISKYLKEYIKYMSQAYPEDNLDPNSDYKRVALFLGHELFINRLSVETQVGFYVYKPYAYESDVYQRVGMKYYFTKQLFAGIALKVHGGRAEAIEAGIGARI